MKRILFIVSLLLFQTILFAQKVTFNTVDSAQTILGQPLITEFATKANEHYENDKLYRARIYNYFRDHGFQNWDEITQAMSELKTNRDYLELVFEVNWRYCLGNDKQCLVKDLLSIGINKQSSGKIADYIIERHKNQSSNHWD